MRLHDEAAWPAEADGAAVAMELVGLRLWG